MVQNAASKAENEASEATAPGVGPIWSREAELPCAEPPLMVDLSFDPESQTTAYRCCATASIDRTGRFRGYVRESVSGNRGSILGICQEVVGRPAAQGVTSICANREKRISLCATVDCDYPSANTDGVGRALSAMTGTVCVVFRGAGSGEEPDGSDESFTSPFLEAICRSERPGLARCSSRHCGQLAGRSCCAHGFRGDE